MEGLHCVDRLRLITRPGVLLGLLAVTGWNEQCRVWCRLDRSDGMKNRLLEAGTVCSHRASSGEAVFGKARSKNGRCSAVSEAKG